MIRLTIDIEERAVSGGGVGVIVSTRVVGVGAHTQLEQAHAEHLCAGLVEIHRNAAEATGADYGEKIQIHPRG